MSFGGKNFACTSAGTPDKAVNKLEVDKRLESMTGYISKNMHAFELS